MEILIHRLREINAELAGKQTADLASGKVAFCTLEYNPDRRRLMLGLTSQATDIFYEFDPADNSFHDLEYQSVAEANEIKIHRSLCLASDGTVYGATASLIDESKRMDCPGGKIFRYDFKTGEYDILGIPCPHDYIQTITLDEPRGLLYGFSYPLYNFFVFDVNARAVIHSQYMGSIPHIGAIDDAGCYWFCWGRKQHHLGKYNPDTAACTFFDHGTPNAVEGAGLMYPGAGPIDEMINGGDGYLYIGETTGLLVRLDPKTAEVTALGKPVEETRMSALTIGPDGRIWGIAGFRERCHLFAYERASGEFEDFGHIQAEGEKIYIGHDIDFVGEDRIFIAETDTQMRSNYLWECRM